jgi:hypothetical protein
MEGFITFAKKNGFSIFLTSANLNIKHCLPNKINTKKL